MTRAKEKLELVIGWPLSALGRISIDAGGNILANGGVGSFSPRGAGNSGGGGSGGGILIHSAESVVLSGGGILGANGGDGGGGFGGPGGGGGGGRVTIALEPGALFSNLGGTINVAGGAGGVSAQPNGFSGGGGSPGVFSVAAVPEPASLVMAGSALLGGLGYTGLRRWATT